MAAKQLTLGQKCIGNGLKIFIIGLQKIKPEEDWTTIGRDIVGCTLWIYAFNLVK